MVSLMLTLCTIIFQNVFFEVSNKHAPLEMVKAKNTRTKKPWITPTIIKLINKKDYAYRQTLNSPFNTKLKFKFKTKKFCPERNT